MSPRLLIVDDEAGQQVKIRSAALRAGFKSNQITIVPSKEEAESSLSDGAFDVAVVDLVLRSKAPPFNTSDGLELISHIHRFHSDCFVIALTTKVGNEEGVQAMIAGAKDFVCSKWMYIAWEELLFQRLQIWFGVAKDRDEAAHPA